MDLVALAQLGDDGPLGMVGVGLLDQRLVLVRVERLAQRGDRLDAVLGQGREQLLVDHVEPVGDPRGARGPQGARWPARGCRARRAGPGQRADRVDPIGVGLRLGPLLVVGELGPAALELVEILVALLLELGELVRRARRGRVDRRRPRRSAAVVAGVSVVVWSSWVGSLMVSAPSMDSAVRPRRSGPVGRRPRRAGQAVARSRRRRPPR